MRSAASAVIESRVSSCFSVNIPSSGTSIGAWAAWKGSRRAKGGTIYVEATNAMDTQFVLSRRFAAFGVLLLHEAGGRAGAVVLRVVPIRGEPVQPKKEV